MPFAWHLQLWKKARHPVAVEPVVELGLQPVLWSVFHCEHAYPRRCKNYKELQHQEHWGYREVGLRLLGFGEELGLGLLYI
jgi:hypothetical protein